MAKFYAAVPIRIGDVKVPLRKVLAQLPDDFHVCLEFKVSSRDFDLVIVHSKGIHIIEVKNEKRPINGGRTWPKWIVRDRNGDIVDEHRNPYNQVEGCARALRDFLRHASKDILLTPCSPRACSDKGLCVTHQRFWSSCQFYSYACIPQWNQENAIDIDSWCLLVQQSKLISKPPYIVDQIQKRRWDTDPRTASLSLTLTEDEIARVIGVVGCVAVTPEQAFGEKPKWRPTIDARVEVSIRSREIDDLRRHLEQHRVVTIIGEPKIGKSTLAQLVAAEIERDGARIVHVDLRSRELTSRFATASFMAKLVEDCGGASQENVQDDIAALMSAVTNNKILLIFDNFEAALDERRVISNRDVSQLLDSLLVYLPGTKSSVLLTSTNLVRTQKTALLPSFRLLGIEKDAAINYLSNRKEYAWPKEQAERIYGVRAGHPYAMHLASAEIKREMNLGLTFEQAFNQLSPDIVNATYGALYSRFTPNEKLVAETLALHHEGLDLEGIEWMVSHAGVTEPASKIVARLYEENAVSKTADGWFRLLPQDQPFVYDKIGSKEKLHRIALVYFKEQGSKLKQDEAAWDRVRNVYERAFFHALKADVVKEGWDTLFSTSLSAELRSRGMVQTLASMSKQLEGCGGFDRLMPGERGQVSLSLGIALRDLGEISEADVRLSAAEKLFGDANDVIGQAAALSEMGILTRKKDQFGRTELDHYDLGLAVLGDRNDLEAKRVRSSILGRKGNALQREGGKPTEVFACLNEALNLAREVDDNYLLITRLCMLGDAYRELGGSGARDFPAALKCFHEALSVAEQSGSDSNFAAAASGLAKTYEKKGDFGQARVLYVQAFEKTPKTDAYSMLDRMGTLAHVLKSLGEFAESEKYYEQALALARRLANKKAEAENLDELGNLHRTRGLQESDEESKARLFQKALEHHQRAVDIQESLEGNPAGRANRRHELGRTFFALGNLSEAKSNFVAAARYARQANRKHLEAWQFRRLGEVFEKLGEVEDAFIAYQNALKLDPQLRGNLMKRETKIRNLIGEERWARLQTRLESIQTEAERLLN